MLGFIQDFWKRRQEIARRHRHQMGYNFAAGQLLQHGKMAVQLLEHYVECSKDFHDYNEYDRGIEDAIQQFSTAGV